MTWDWPQIANIASVMGVVGGLISVVFVIFGLRRNARATEGATVQALMSFGKDVYALLLAQATTFRPVCADRPALAVAGHVEIDASAAGQARENRLAGFDQMAMVQLPAVQDQNRAALANGNVV